MERRLMGLVVGLVAASAGASGCGNVSGGGTCGQVQPCGGAVVGSWKFVDSCVNSAVLTAMLATTTCPQATASVDLADSGTISFNADLTYSAAVTHGVTITETLPVSCTGQSCASYSAYLQMTNADPTMMSVSCAGGSVCTCRFVMAPQSGNDTGTYTTAGTTLDDTTSAGVAASRSYCVQGGELHMIAVDTTMSMGPMGQVVIASDAVLQPQ